MARQAQTSSELAVVAIGSRRNGASVNQFVATIRGACSLLKWATAAGAPRLRAKMLSA